MASIKARDIKRFNQVFTTILKYEWSSFWKKPSDLKNPETLRKIIEELGGTFVKLGQFLSLRPDLIPQKYCDELEKLQDHVKPFEFSQVKKIVEKSIGKKINQVFSSFEKKPIASASIGQVHRARLRTGSTVAVKVKRPDIEHIINTDMEILEVLAKQLQKHINSEVFDPEGIIEELKKYSENEMDFMLEASKIKKFHLLFDGSPVKIPKPFIALCSRELIVMEFVEGKKLNDFINNKVSIKRKKEIVDHIVNAFFKQIFMDGYFHADPHPGNILILDKKNKENKTIAFLDFGITGEITRDVKESMVHLFTALIDRDIEHIIDAMAELHFIDAESPELRRDMRDMLGPYYGASLNQIDVPKLFIQSMKVARKNNIKVPKDYVLLGKTLVTLESICSLLDPDFDLVTSSKPFVTKLMIRKYTPSHLASRGIAKIESLKEIFEELPELTRQYIKRDMEHEKQMDALSGAVVGLEKEVKMIADKFLTLGAVFILLLGAYFFTSYSQPMAYILFILAIMMLFWTFILKKIRI